MAAICVFCASSTEIDPVHLTLAAAVGTALGERGHRLISGGGAISAMGALARAARAAGAHTTGVIPRGLRELELADHDADELLIVEDMRTRKGEMDARADAFLVLPGGIGTLEELLEIWVSRSLGMHDRPVVVLDPTGVFDPLWLQIEALIAQRFMRATAAQVLGRAPTVPEALDLIEAQCSTGEAGRVPGAGEVLEGLS